MNRTIPTALAIAGSDSGGGAGIQADLRTFTAFGVFGTSAITALTSQNPDGVSRIDPVAPEGVKSQIVSVRTGLEVRAVKSGMVFSAAIAEKIAEALEGFAIPYIADPVMISTSGSNLLNSEDIDTVARLLFSRAQWLTPNRPETLRLTGILPDSPDSLRAAGEKLFETYGCSVVLKGGHGMEKEAVDWIFHAGKIYRLHAERLDVDPRTAHGTGCTFSAAFTAGLALGKPWQEAMLAAKNFVSGSLLHAVHVGGSLSQMFPPGEAAVQTAILEEV